MSKKSLILVIIQFSSFAYFATDGFMAKQGTLLFYIQIFAFLFSIWGVLAMKIGNFNIQPEVKETATIVTSGPYKLVRNPMYSGIILFFGISLISIFSYIRLAIYLALVVVLVMKIFMEEGFMENKFGRVYLEYKGKSFRLIPFLF